MLTQFVRTIGIFLNLQLGFETFPEKAESRDSFICSCNGLAEATEEHLNHTPRETNWEGAYFDGGECGDCRPLCDVAPQGRLIRFPSELYSEGEVI